MIPRRVAGMLLKSSVLLQVPIGETWFLSGRGHVTLVTVGSSRFGSARRRQLRQLQGVKSVTYEPPACSPHQTRIHNGMLPTRRSGRSRSSRCDGSSRSSTDSCSSSSSGSLVVRAVAVLLLLLMMKKGIAAQELCVVVVTVEARQ